MSAVCKFIATANKAFTNGKILRKTVFDKNIATGNNYASLEIFDQTSTPRFWPAFYEIRTKTQAQNFEHTSVSLLFKCGAIGQMPFEK